MDGMALLQNARTIIPSLPIILVSGYGDIPLAVKVMQAGAVDFIEKPLDLDVLLSRIASVLDGNGKVMKARELLTKCEERVLRLVYAGMTNKEIAQKLYRSVRTVEDHRCHLMHKLGVDNVVDLVKLADRMGYHDAGAKTL